MRVLDQDGSEGVRIQRGFDLAAFGRVDPTPALLLQGRRLLTSESRLQPLLDPELHVHGAVLLDARHELREHGQALGVGGASWAQLTRGGARCASCKLVPLEQHDLMPIEAEPLRNGAADDPSTNDDNPRHKEKIAIV